MAFDPPLGTTTLNSFDIEDFRIDDSFLTSEISQGDDYSINMLIQISNAIPLDDHKNKSPETQEEILHSKDDSNDIRPPSATKAAQTKKLLQGHVNESGSVPEAFKKICEPNARQYFRAEKQQRKNRRSKMGCWTCRLRHKACPEDNDPCSACVRLGLKCDWSISRPSYMTDSKKAAVRLKQIRNTTDRLRKRFCRVHQ